MYDSFFSSNPISAVSVHFNVFILFFYISVIVYTSFYLTTVSAVSVHFNVFILFFLYFCDCVW